MKHIDKASEPALFSHWKNENIPLRMGYGELHSDVKNVLHVALIQEQGGICCYCERRISLGDSHIEHFCPQRGVNACPDQTLDYQNIHASCQKNLSPGEPHHCGTLKEEWFNSGQLISPLDPGCETHFRFAGDGTIYPAGSHDEPAKITIEKLGLAIDKLCKLREAAIKELEDLSTAEVQKILNTPQTGNFQEFFTAIRAVLT